MDMLELLGPGYDPSRFIGEVKDDLLCCVCHDVLNNPRLCENGSHSFCSYCISNWLEINATCPECREPLTLATLKYPQRFMRNYLSALIIKCDYVDRGYSEQVKLENLHAHKNGCEYGPEQCEFCTLQFNRRDMTEHQNFCMEMTEIKGRHDNLYHKVKKMKKQFNDMKQTQSEMNDKINEMDDKINEMDNNEYNMEEIQNSHSSGDEEDEG
ncbi:E3 ubiquitin-protein ligase NRDP1-like [Dendronephthya gigantea]|uniref:E3 ubiquitin-protein ligase NRDP1-like n=1 Tax=Dendronephthya gigantea TaxID=151771 RepID=UPI001069F43D|nr:E3 ubiquitin-protein ligase NRDP1-like [Dendronephthya gigantea]